MSMEYIRRTYGVPAKRGNKVAFNPTGYVRSIGVIIGSRGQYLRVRWDGDGATHTLHPTWRVEYLKTPNAI